MEIMIKLLTSSDQIQKDQDEQAVLKIRWLCVSDDERSFVLMIIDEDCIFVLWYGEYLSPC